MSEKRLTFYKFSYQACSDVYLKQNKYELEMYWQNWYPNGALILDKEDYMYRNLQMVY